MVGPAPRTLRFLAGTILVLGGAAAYAQDDAAAEIIRTKVEQLRSASELRIGTASVASVTVLPDLYERRGFQPAWSDPRAIAELIDAVRSSDADGLDPDDYHLAELKTQHARLQAQGTTDPVMVADFDILLTDALIRLAYHLLFGKVDPEQLDPNWNLGRQIRDTDPAVAVQRLIASGAVAAGIDELRPQDEIYHRLRSALARYREIAARGGWPSVPPGETLKPGIRSERVVSVRRRLAATGDWEGNADDPTLFDAPLEQAVIRFQERHRLGADGVVGPKTLAAMNVPVEQRIDQIRINLERGRWLLHEDLADFVIVDIAGFEISYHRNEERVWSGRVQVGKPYRQTPVFKSAIKYLVLNPTWTVPPGILAKDILPAMKRDPAYLQQRNMKVIDSSGSVVPASSINWSTVSARTFRYQLRQDPGPANALGRIKFIFPNPHFVYLHDTPSQSLFERTDRAFSSGCIRVEDPITLAELLLAGHGGWDRQKIESALATRKTRTVMLPAPFPVLLFYWTVAVAEDGTVSFKPDVYNRDRAVLEDLDSGFSFRNRPVASRPTL